MVAADGASSPVRSLVGVGLEGTPDMQHLINIHFTSASLASALRDSGNAAMLYFVFNPDVVAVVVAHDLRDDGTGASVLSLSSAMLRVYPHSGDY